MRKAVLAIMLGSTFAGLSSFAPVAVADRDRLQKPLIG